MPGDLIFQTMGLPAPLLLHECGPAPPWTLYKLTLPVGYDTTKKYSRSQTNADGTGGERNVLYRYGQISLYKIHCTGIICTE